jgi:glyoxylase-like metal-dependent hydrolase (beta-lactamase superfamily II)
MLEQIDGAGEIFPGIELRLCHGHTRAMQMVIVHGNEESVGGLVYCADLVPTSAHLPAPYIMGYDNFPLTSLEEKKAFLPEAHERNWLLCFEHDAFTDAARIETTAKGFAIAERLEMS